MCPRCCKLYMRRNVYGTKLVRPDWFETAIASDRLGVGLSDDDELHQYVVHDATPNKGPRRINLDDKAKDKYAPPESITIHLSKIPMPELQPKAISPEATVKESKSEEKARKKEEKAKKKYESKGQAKLRRLVTSELTKIIACPVFHVYSTVSTACQ